MNNKIITQANELIEGRSDGRISLPDMNILLENNIQHEGDIKSLFYIYGIFNLTDTAKERLYKEIFKWANLYTVVKKTIYS